MYQSTKVIDGFSTCFRQWRAVDSHCSLLHGYSLKFKLVFEAETLDDKNWVQDFGFTKEPFPYKIEGMDNVKSWFSYMYDHTLIVAIDDPWIGTFKKLGSAGLASVRVHKNVGCEAFAENVFEFINAVLILTKQDRRVRLKSVECMEHEKNSAIYIPNQK
jgi:6-pyruvoyltetrahydropterin/6-carboxytetrahydropterin synthase